MLPDWLKYDLQDRWERWRGRSRCPGLGDWLDGHRGAITFVAVVLVVLLLATAIRHVLPEGPGRAETVEREWYYDLNTGKLFVAEVGRTPPITAPSGPLPSGDRAGVRAHVFSYVDEPNESERFVAFIQTGTGEEVPQDRPARRRSHFMSKAWAQGKLIRRVTDDEWVPADSPAGQRILEEAFASDSRRRKPAYCTPD